MKDLFIFILAGLISFCSYAQNRTDEQSIRKLITSFTDDLNKSDFSRIADYGIKDWVHINSNGVATYGRDEVAAEIFYQYKEMSKGTKIAIENMTMRMLPHDAAMVTVIDKIDNTKQIRTYVLVKQNEKWLLSLDQSTTVKTQ